MEKILFNWNNAFLKVYTDLASNFVEHTPQILGAVSLLILGWFISKFFRMSVINLVNGLDSLFHRISKSGKTQRDKLKSRYARLAGGLTFWLVMLFFLMTASHVLGWQVFTNIGASVTSYLPNFLSGFLIIVVGIFIANGAKELVLTLSESAQLGHKDLLAGSTQFLILLTTFLTGINQSGVDVNFLTTLVVVIVAVLLSGLALTFSLGAKGLISNIVGAQYFKKHCSNGTYVEIGDIKGTLVEVSKTSIIIDTGTGTAIVPAKAFHESVILTSFNAPPSNKKKTK